MKTEDANRAVASATPTDKAGTNWVCGAGSPETHRMTVLRGADIEAKKRYAKDIAGIRESKKDSASWRSVSRLLAMSICPASGGAIGTSASIGVF